MTYHNRELVQNITYCLGDGGHIAWGSKARYNWDAVYEVMPEAKMLEPDNPSFDYSQEVINFIQERVAGGAKFDFSGTEIMIEIKNDKTDNTVKLAATGLAALGIAATIYVYKKSLKLDQN